MVYYYRQRGQHILPGWVAGNYPSNEDVADMFLNAGGESRLDWTFTITGIPSEVSPDTNFAGYDEFGNEMWRWTPGEVASRSYYKTLGALEYSLQEMAVELHYSNVQTLSDVIDMLYGRIYNDDNEIPEELDASLVASYITDPEGITWRDVSEIFVADKVY